MKTKLKKFSVLLLYPDDMRYEDANETFYTHVEAVDVKAAVVAARREAADHNGMTNGNGFAVLLVTAGHNFGLATD